MISEVLVMMICVMHQFFGTQDVLSKDCNIAIYTIFV